MKMNWSKWILSLCGGLSVALLMGEYWDHREKKWLEHQDTVTIWVMKKNVPAGKKLRLDCVELRQVPKIYAEPGVFSSGGKEIIFASSSTMRARIGLKVGEQVTRSKIMDQDNRLGLSWTLPPEQTAMSIKLSREDAVAGFIQPGDWICVFGTLEKPGLVLKQVRVLAVQDQLVEAEQDESMKGHLMAEGAILLTLSVRREEGVLLSRAMEHGRVSVALLPAIDEGEGAL